MDFWTRIRYYITLLLLACPDCSWGTSNDTSLSESEDDEIKTYDPAELHKNKDLRVSRLSTVYIALSNEQLRIILRNADDRLVMLNFSNLLIYDISHEAPNEYSWTYLRKLARKNLRLFVVNADVQKCLRYASHFKINTTALPETVFVLENVLKDRVKGVNQAELEAKIKKYYQE